MTLPARPGPRSWLQRYCPSLDGQFLFLNPLSWETLLLSEGSVLVLREAAAAIEEGRFASFCAEVDDVGGWPPGLEFQARALATLAPAAAPTGAE